MVEPRLDEKMGELEEEEEEEEEEEKTTTKVKEAVTWMMKRRCGNITRQNTEEQIKSLFVSSCAVNWLGRSTADSKLSLCPPVN